MNQRYLPPSARMRQIKAKAPVALPLEEQPEVEAAEEEPKVAAKPKAAVPKPKPVEAKKPEPVAVEKPEYSDKTLKRELLELAEDAELDVLEDNTKAEILAALDEHYGADD